MFDLDTLIADCTAALGEASPQLAIKEILAATVSDAPAVAHALNPARAELSTLYSSAELTIANVVWGPAMVLPPHDHRMWAVIGVYQGEEDNTFFRRTGDGIVTSGGKQLATSELAVLGSSTIHSVANTRTHSHTGAIHIYGGDFMHQPRSMWDPDTLEESPADGASVQRLFEEANAAAQRD